MLTIENNQKSVRIAFNGQSLLRYQADTPASKPHFDRVALPPTAEARPGENIVLAAPHDQVWHLGLFFSPGFVDGLNFCESERLAALKERYGECRNAGRVSSVVKDDGCVAFSHDIRWRTSDDQTWMTERRDIIVHPPRGNAYRIDWKMVWTSVSKGRVWTSPFQGAASGLSFRTPRSMNGAGGQALSSEGGNTIGELHARKARWCDYTGKLDGKIDFSNPDKAGITLMDHPQNHDHPNLWFATTEPNGFLTTNLMSGKTWTMKKDEPITARFGILVHCGEPDRDCIESEYRIFAEWI